MILSHLDEETVIDLYGDTFFIRSSAPGNVWMSGSFGVLAYGDWTRRWNGTAWETHDSVFGLIDSGIYGGFDLWAGGTNRVWYFNSTGAWQYDGSAWSHGFTATNGSSGWFAGSSASDLYCFLGGNSSGLGVLNQRYWNGAAWSAVTSHPVNWPFASFYNVHARPAGMTPDGTLYAGIQLQARVFSLDDASIVAYLDGGGTWQPGLTLDAGRVVWTLWAADNSNIFVLSQYLNGGANEYFLWQGSGASWTTVAVPTAPAGHVYRWYGVHGVSASDYWLVGEDWVSASSTSQGIAVHWTGAGWTTYTFPPAGGATFTCAAVTAVATDDVWIGATTSTATYVHTPTAYHWDGSSWTERSPFA